MTDKTVAQHLADSAALSQTIADANALVIKLQKQIHEDREIIDLLGKWSHPKLKISPLYGPWVPRDINEATGEAISKISVARINALLGDRA
jgi:hypothetical protein